ncbi:MAG TPA: hypothetical protein VF239_20655, partial [Vicinamibacterales bacterium]
FGYRNTRHLNGVLMLAVWMYGTLVSGARKAGFIMMLGAMLGILISVGHMRGAGSVAFPGATPSS